MTPNYYNLSGKSTKVIYHADASGPIVAGAPPKGPTLEYSSGSLDVTVSGDDLKPQKLAVGTLVTALIRRGGVPGAATYFSLLLPDVNLAGHNVNIRTLGILSNIREVSNVGPGQRETYTEVELSGTAAQIAVPLVKKD